MKKLVIVLLVVSAAIYMRVRIGQYFFPEEKAQYYREAKEMAAPCFPAGFISGSILKWS